MKTHAHKLLVAAFCAASLIAVSSMAACSHGRVDTYGRVEIIDNDGFHHNGYYDDRHDWHGGWYDHDNHFHDDPHDWHR